MTALRWAVRRVRRLPLVTLNSLRYAISQSVLGSLGHAHQRRPQGSTVQLIAHFGHHGNGPGLLALYGGMEERLVLVWVELLALRVELEQAVLGEDLLDLDLGHHQAVVQVLQVRVLTCHLLFRDALHGLLQDVGHLQEVLTEALNAWREWRRFEQLVALKYDYLLF